MAEKKVACEQPKGTDTWAAEDLKRAARASSSTYERMRSEKIEAAKELIIGCKRENGFYASEERYREDWLRDTVYSVNALLRLGYAREVKRHLEEIMKLQQGTGQLPTVIDNPIRKAFGRRSHFWVSDGEILFIIGMKKYDNFTHDGFFKGKEREVELALSFVESRQDGHGFVKGMDWRDAMPNYERRFLLANQMNMVEMYELLGKRERAEALKEMTNKIFYSKERGYYADSVDWKENKLKRDFHFDSLGNALAVMNGTAPKEAHEGILRGFESAKTPFGYRNIFPSYDIYRPKLFETWYDISAFVIEGAIFRNSPGKYQNSTIWPFVESRVICALGKSGAHFEAEDATRMMLERKGFNEYYDPVTGKQKGSAKQLWTAAAVLTASHEEC